MNAKRFISKGKDTLRRLWEQDSGLSAVEFAFIAPVMAGLLMSAYEISDALTAYRRVSNVASTIADLTAQDTNVKDDEMADIMNSGAIVMTPYGSNFLHLRIVSIEFDNDGDASVAWSDTQNWSDDPSGCLASIPEATQIPNMSVICGEAKYDYSSLLGYLIPGIKYMEERYYLVPRKTIAVTRTP